MKMKTRQQLFEEGSIAWDAGKSRQAFALFLQAAELGDPGAQLNVGHFYETGESVRKDIAKALYWYKSAWRHGRQTGACSNIAQLHASAGRKRLAMSWWKKAVDRGDGDAALDLAKFLLRGNKRTEIRATNLLNVATKSKRISPVGIGEAKTLLQIFGRRKQHQGRSE
jgi:TPR repeat protein